MSIVTLFRNSAPSIAGYEFDAILEDTLELEVETTTYPIESGASAADHRIVQPFRWTLVGAVSNNPIQPVVTDFVGAVSDNPAAGLVAGLLSGSNDTRASDALAFLIDLATQREAFSIDAGDIQLDNMVIARISRTKEPRNENGLEFIAELQEYPTLDVLLGGTQPKQSQLPDGDPAKSQAAALINRGEQAIRDAGQNIRDAIAGIFG